MKKSRILNLIVLLLLPLLAVSCIQRSVWQLESALGRQEYRSYDELIADLKVLQDLRPDIAQVHSLGKTYEGRDIWAIEVGIEDPEREDPKPEILVIGCIHANEWIAKEVVLHFAERLVEEEKSNEEIRSLLGRANIWLVPVANPDGMVYSENHDRQWRKNRRAYGGDIYGVDPNRGYPFMWRVPSEAPDNPRPEGGRDNPTSVHFRGYPDINDTSKPAEIQNEVLAILSLVSDPEMNFVLFLDYHSFGELVLYPPGFTKDASPDEEAYVELAAEMADEINKARRSSKLIKIFWDSPLSYLYRVVQIARLYPEIVTGSSIDMTYHVYGIWSLGIELPPGGGRFARRELLYLSGNGYRLPASRILPTCLENWPGFMFACNWALERDPPKVQTPNPKPRYEAVR